MLHDRSGSSGRRRLDGKGSMNSGEIINSVVNRIGFMQGRLSPQVDGRIQAFPWTHWRDEFARARECGLSLMEWTLDHDRLDENPLMTSFGRREIRQIADDNGLRI